LLSIRLERAVRQIHADINDVVRFFHLQLIGFRTQETFAAGCSGNRSWRI